MDNLHSHETELEGSRCGPPYGRLKGTEYFWFMGTVYNVWQCGKGTQGPVFTHRVLRKHEAQVGFGCPPRAYVREAATQAGEFQDHAGTQKAVLTKRRWGCGGCAMCACSFGRLLQFLNKQLDLDGRLEVYDHLDRCDICRDAVYQLSRDRDEAFFIYPAPCCVQKLVAPHPVDAAG